VLAYKNASVANVTRAVPSLVRFVRQSGHHGDCTVAALAMFAGVMYEDALLACARVRPNVLESGLMWPEIKKAAKRLGLNTKCVQRYDISEATGVLHVSRVALGAGSGIAEHVVMLWEGRVVDGNGELWRDPDDYLRHYGMEARGLLIAVED
jgi:hypothetical protein